MMMKMWERQQTMMIICERKEDREEKGKLGKPRVSCRFVLCYFIHLH
jgi:hypothetical protein